QVEHPQAPEDSRAHDLGTALVAEVGGVQVQVAQVREMRGTQERHDLIARHEGTFSAVCRVHANGFEPWKTWIGGEDFQRIVLDAVVHKQHAKGGQIVQYEQPTHIDAVRKKMQLFEISRAL